MTAPELITVVGAGSALLLAGFALLGGAASVALATYVPQIHLSVWLCIIGGAMLILGLVIVERGGAKTVEKVGTEFSMPQVVSNFPWAFITLSVSATLFTVWLFRKRKPEKVSVDLKPYVMASRPPDGESVTIPPVSPIPPPKRTTLTDVLVPLGSAAAAYATSVGMKALGIPSPAEVLQSVIQKFMAADHPKAAPPSKRSTGSHSHNGYEAAMRRS